MLREEAVIIIKTFVQSLPEITCAWEGGSVATGFSDELSDLDLHLICHENDKEAVLTEMMEFLEKQFGIERSYRVPEPAWHGFSQVYVKTKKTPEFFYVDFVVLGDDNVNKMTEENRHGIGELWVDNGSITHDPLGEDEVLNICKTLYKKTIAHDFVLVLELKKAIKRGVYLELYPLYMAFLSRGIIPLLNIKERPDKADFGMRYIYREYSIEYAELIERMLKVTSVEDISENMAVLFGLYETLKESLSYLSEE